IRDYAMPILRGERAACLGMSEPGAGSDLASLSTRAVLDGDQFVINGQKVWTSGANYADFCFLFCRTDPSAAKHKGISVVLVEMRAALDRRPAEERAVAADHLVQSYVDSVAARCLGYRGFAKLVRGGSAPEQALMKAFSSESSQRLALAASESIGGRWRERY